MFAGIGDPAYFGDTGPAIVAALNLPLNINFDGQGRLYIADLFNGRVRRVEAPNIPGGVNPGTVQAVPGVSVGFGSSTTSAGSLTSTAGLTGPSAPFNFDLGPAGKQVYYDIIYTGTGGGPYTISVFFDTQFASCAGLALMHFSSLPPCTLSGCNVTTSCSDTTHIITGQVTSFSVFTVVGPNQPPVALASATPSVAACAGPGGTAVTLDASASTDPGDDIASYQWIENGSVIATGEVASVLLPGGNHSIELLVTDASGAASTAAVPVTITDDQPPSVTIRVEVVPELRGRCDVGCAAFRVLAAEVTDDCDPNPRLESLTLNGERVAAGDLLRLQLKKKSHEHDGGDREAEDDDNDEEDEGHRLRAPQFVFSATAADSAGNSSSTSAAILLEDFAGAHLRIGEVVPGTERGRGTPIDARAQRDYNRALQRLLSRGFIDPPLPSALITP
jgi:hypothetical protein